MLKRRLILFAALVALGGALFFWLRPRPLTWSQTAIAARGSRDTVLVFQLRNNANIHQTALTYALSAKLPAVLVYQPFAAMPFDRAALAASHPYLEWIAVPSEDMVYDSILSEVVRRHPGKKIEWFTSEVSLNNSHQNRRAPKSGFDRLLRLASKFHVFEEGMSFYIYVGSHLEQWIRKGHAGNPAHHESWLHFFDRPNFRWYVSRRELLPPRDYFDLDPKEAWAALSAEDRQDLARYFHFDVERVRNIVQPGAKPNVLVLGGVQEYPRVNELMEKWIAYVHRKLGGRNKLFFKAHPRDRFLADLLQKKYPGQFTVVPAAIPFELLDANGVQFDSYAVFGLSSVLLRIPPSRLDHVFELTSGGPLVRDTYQRLIAHDKVVAESELEAKAP